MASPITTTTGLGSGLAITDIVSALVTSDKAAKQTQITTQTTLNTSRISGIGSLKSALATFQAAMTKLNSTTNPAFGGYAATSSNATAVNVTSNNSAVAGNYAISVTSLATGSKVASKAFDGGVTQPIDAGTLSIKVGTGTALTVEIGADATLQSVRDSINTKLKDSGISANIITDGAGKSRLVIGSSTTGEGNDIDVSGIPQLRIDGTQSMTSTDADGKPVVLADSAGYISAKATDAQFTVDGLAMTSKSNTASSVVSGLSFELLAKGDSKITVATNTDGLKTSVQSFVDAYNTLIKTVSSLTKPTTDANGKNVAAALAGDATPRSLLASVRNVLVSSGAGSQLTALSQLGIKTSQTDGTLQFDSATFETTVKTKGLSGEVQNMFTGTNGVLERMGTALKQFSDTGGILDSKTTQYNKLKTNLVEQQSALDRRVETLTKVLTQKYTAMDKLVGQLKATASSITSMFDALNAQKNA